MAREVQQHFGATSSGVINESQNIRGGSTAAVELVTVIKAPLLADLQKVVARLHGRKLT